MYTLPEHVFDPGLLLNIAKEVPHIRTRIPDSLAQCTSGGGDQVENQIVDSRGALVGHEEGENGRGNHELITTASSESATTVHTNG